MESPTRQYVPVEVRESPLSKHGNLTGNARKVRDMAAEIFNQIQEWNKQQELGMAVLYNIMNVKIQHFSRDEKTIENIYPTSLQELCDQLGEICSAMEAIVDGLEKSFLQFTGLCKLEILRQTQGRPIFLTWPIQEYVDLSEMVSESYKKEVQVKLTVKEYVAHSTSQDELMTYLTTWAHQPYIDESIDFKMEAMLKETGHR